MPSRELRFESWLLALRNLAIIVVVGATAISILWGAAFLLTNADQKCVEWAHD